MGAGGTPLGTRTSESGRKAGNQADQAGQALQPSSRLAIAAGGPFSPPRSWYVSMNRGNIDRLLHAGERTVDRQRGIAADTKRGVFSLPGRGVGARV